MSKSTEKRLEAILKRLETAVDKLEIQQKEISKRLTSFDKPIKKKKFSTEIQKLLDSSVEVVGLPSRVVSACQYGGIKKISDLVRLTKRDFKKLRNAGKKTTDDIENFLNNNGLSWGMSV